MGGSRTLTNATSQQWRPIRVDGQELAAEEIEQASVCFSDEENSIPDQCMPKEMNWRVVLRMRAAAVFEVIFLSLPERCLALRNVRLAALVCPLLFAKHGNQGWWPCAWQQKCHTGHTGRPTFVAAVFCVLVFSATAAFRGCSCPSAVCGMLLHLRLLTIEEIWKMTHFISLSLGNRTHLFVELVSLL